jgi:hypothetical protein
VKSVSYAQSPGEGEHRKTCVNVGMPAMVQNRHPCGNTNFFMSFYIRTDELENICTCHAQQWPLVKYQETRYDGNI